MTQKYIIVETNCTFFSWLKDIPLDWLINICLKSFFFFFAKVQITTPNITFWSTWLKDILRWSPVVHFFYTGLSIFWCIVELVDCKLNYFFFFLLTYIIVEVSCTFFFVQVYVYFGLPLDWWIKIFFKCYFLLLLFVKVKITPLNITFLLKWKLHF